MLLLNILNVLSDQINFALSYQQRTKNEERETVSPDVVISVEGLWKQYRYGTISHATLRKDIQSWWARMRGKEDPNLPIGMEQSAKSKASDSMPSVPATMLSGDDRFWALQDVNFEVKRGEVLGIIGRNGAGKSTLLKILSKVTTPTKGQIKIKGRVASLLEVGTGFHPELTGGENIYLNGAILGMTKDEIRRKFDEIVAFAEIEKFIDTPVKRYSSGMYVRLAFAVAAHLEPEILIIDEVLAVGDVAFQRKCLGKMGDVAKEGRTVLFVSHNMTAVQGLCNTAMLLDQGKRKLIDRTLKVIEEYQLANKDSTNHFGKVTILPETSNFIRSIQTKTVNGLIASEFAMGSKLIIELETTNLQKYPNVIAGVSVSTIDGVKLFGFHTAMVGKQLSINENDASIIHCEIEKLFLTPGEYLISVSLTRDIREYLTHLENVLSFVVSEADVYGKGFNITRDYGLVYVSGSWEIIKT